jgi:hypothetical protein
VLDSGKLKLPDGNVFSGDFTIGFMEGCDYTYYAMPTNAGAYIPFT